MGVTSNPPPGAGHHSVSKPDPEWKAELKGGRVTIGPLNVGAFVVAGASQEAQPGALSVLNKEMKHSVRLDGGRSEIKVWDHTGNPSVLLDGLKADLTLGSSSEAGQLILRRPGYKDAVIFSGSTASMRFVDDAGQPTLNFDGQRGHLDIGGKTAAQAGRIVLMKEGQVAINIDGSTGDIVLQNADFAEDFDIAPDEADVMPGSVMVIDDKGQLRQSRQAYDRRVAGVLAGAGSYRPAIVLDRQETPRRRMPISLVGKVYCRADAREAPIRIGDMLTTAENPGHAMRADDPMRAFGAVLGKALAGLSEGVGLIPVLIALQ